MIKAKYKPTILHTGDWHFSEKNYEEVAKCVRFIVDAARDRKPDAIIVAGDLTDSMYLRLDTKSAKQIAESIKDMADIAPVFICLGTLTHDGKSPEILRNISGEHPVIVSSVPEQYIVCDLDGRSLVEKVELLSSPESGKPYVGYLAVEPSFCITLIPALSKVFLMDMEHFKDGKIEYTDIAAAHVLTDIFRGFGAVARNFPDVPHVMTSHHTIGGALVSPTQKLKTGHEIELSKDQVMSANPTVACFGHIHHAQQIDDLPIFYCGSVTRLNHGETDSNKGFYIHSFEEGSLTGSEFVETPAKKLLDISVDLTTEDVDGDEFDLLFRLKLAPQGKDVSGAHVKIKIKARVGVVLPSLTEIKKQYTGAGAASVDIAVSRIPVMTVVCDTSEAETLPEKIRLHAEATDVNHPPDVISEILDKAAMLETQPHECVLKNAGEWMQQEVSQPQSPVFQGTGA